MTVVCGHAQNKQNNVLPRTDAGVARRRAYLSPNDNHTGTGRWQTSTQARRLHAAGQHPHRRLALSRRLAGRQLQLRTSKRYPDAGGRQVRRLLHGRPPRRAEHAGRGAEAQPHRDLVRAVHAAVGAGRRHRAHRPDRDRLDHLRRALSRRPPLRLARPHLRRPRRLEHRHHLQPRRGAEFRARRAHGARRALPPGARVLRRGHGPVGQLRRRRLRARRRDRDLFRSRQDACARPQGQIPQGARAAEHRPAGAGLAGDRAGRRLRGRPAARRRDRGGRVRRRRQPWPTAKSSMPTSRAAWTSSAATATT